MFIRLLGEVSFGDDSSSLSTPQGLIPSAVLAHLALARGRVLTSESLIDAVWDVGPESSRNSIQVAITKLRHQLGAENIEATRVGYRLRTDLLRIDWFEAEHLLQASRQFLERGRHTDALEASEAAGQLYVGTPLARLSSTAAEGARQAANELYAAVMVCYAKALRGLNRMDEAAALLKGEVAKDPFNDQLHALLIHSLAVLGRQAEALTVYDSLRRNLRDHLGVSPSDATQKLFRNVLDGIPGQGSEVPPRRLLPALSLPRPGSSLIGREREIQKLKGLVDDGHRLITLVGPGGIGKTRLAIEAVMQIATSNGRPAVFVDLTKVESNGDVMECVAGSLQIEAATVIGRLHDTGTVLILDNAEHVIHGAAAMALELLAIDGINLFVTSQCPLHLQSEMVVDVDGLDVEGAVSPALRLLADRAGIRGVDIDVLHGDLDALVRKVDGIPLALELLSSALRWQTPHEIRAELPSTLKSLEGSATRDQIDRHSSILAAIRWSMENASDDARMALRALTVIKGSFSLGAATKIILVSGSADLPRQLLAELIDLSLVKRLSQAGEVRFRILEPIRLFARGDRRQSAAVMTAYAHHYLETLAQVHHSFSESSNAFDQFIRVEFQNLQQALTWVWAHSPDSTLQYLAPMLYGWYRSCHREDSLKWINRALGSKLGTPAERSLLMLVKLLCLSELPEIDTHTLNDLSARIAPYADTFDAEWRRRWVETEVDRARREGDLVRALAITEEFSQSTPLDRYKYFLERGSVFASLGRWKEAEASLAQILGETLDHHSVTRIYGLSSLGYLKLVQGKYQESERQLQQALVIALHSGTPMAVICVEINLAWLALHTGKAGRALNLVATTLAESSELGDPLSLAEAFTIAGLALLELQESELATVLAGAAAFYGDVANGLSDPFGRAAIARLTDAVAVPAVPSATKYPLLELIQMIQQAAKMHGPSPV